MLPDASRQEQGVRRAFPRICRSVPESGFGYGRFHPERANLPRSGSATERGGAAVMGSRRAKKMKVIIFSVKFAKFTGFFDKFLKIISPVNDCNQKGCHINFSVSHSDLAAKKVFSLPRISPQPPAFAHRRGFGSTRLMRGLLQQFPRERGVPFGLMNERAAGGAISSLLFPSRSVPASRGRPRP